MRTWLVKLTQLAQDTTNMKRFLITYALLGFCWIVGAQQSGFKNVGVEEFDKLRKQTNVMVLDVRTPKEFAAGHIAGATNIDWYATDFPNKVAGLDKSKTWLVHCAGGVRSGKASDKMAALQFTNVYNLKDGFKGWEKAGKPVEK
jgi:phage shock protein E